ncbi:MAG: DUF4351 domain-containing protein [Gomphosphaeria aponina SAG 52.96 = DSM 107014]|uniref:DUF4351 domain-containing protein n=1 Tax=Gomphosphaeria aponina SAG 52.96 = DSM 107014 TaxID=1521640 RepID=A0A941JMU1_9CHRO|nr:DUF4351 domain-containing protein [Gomphosphaeria aponina SAG 52.96 = DSM 107014]
MILRQLSRRFGTIAPELSSSIESLSSEQLSFLGEAIFELDSLEKVAEFLNS